MHADNGDRTVRCVLEAVFGASRRFQLAPIHSHMHLCRRVRGDAGEYFVKVCSDPAAAVDLERGGRIQRAAYVAGVRVPEVVAVGEVPDRAGLGFVVQRWVPGRPASEEIEGMRSGQREALAENLGHNLAKLATEVEIEHRWSAERWLEGRRARLERLLSINREVGNIEPDQTQKIAARCRRLLDGPLGGIPGGVAHGDMLPSNVIVDRDGFAAIIDFDRAGAADPLLDLVKVDTGLFIHHPECIAPFLDAYRAIAPLGPLWQRRLYLYQGIEYLRAASLLHGFPDEAAHYRSLFARWLANDELRWVA